MNDIKVYNAFHYLEKLSNDIRLEVDTLMGNISEWAGDLEAIIEKENKDCSSFLLPKTPKERKTYRRKARNALNSKCSVINSSTFLPNESCNLDGTISSRTRNAKRAATFKMSELNLSKNLKLEESKQEVIVEKSLVGNATFVMPKASTRTKPVLTIKQSEELVQEPEKNEASNTMVGSSKHNSPLKKVSNIEPQGSSGCTIPETPGESSEERLSDEKTPVIVKEMPEKCVGRRKISRTLSVSPTERSSTRKARRTLSGGPAVGRADSTASRNSNGSVERQKSSRNVSGRPLTRSGGNKMSQELKGTTPEDLNFLSDRTITIKKEEFTPKAMSTFVVYNETCRDSSDEIEKTPVGNEKRFSRLSNTSTPVISLGKTPVIEVQNTSFEENKNEGPVNATHNELSECMSNIELSVTETEETNDNSEVPKKKKKVKKKKEAVKENIEEPLETMRITRTKSKALQQMIEENETKQADLSSLAKKVLNKAKMTSAKKSQLAALLESNSSMTGHLGNGLPFGNLTASKSKYHLLLSSTKKLKTPSSVIKGSADKDRPKPKIANGDASVEQLVRTATKPPKDDLIEKEMKLKSRKEKEEEAALKRQNVIKIKQEELRRKNELKHQMAMKQREKLEQEKYHNMIQSEKEKEERHKLILQERQAKVKEEAQKRKLLTQQKLAETVERRRIEEEARIAKLKEMEEEERRLALEKQKEQERQEKRAQERLAQKKAREEYEMQIKQELEAERLKAGKLLSGKKCTPSTSKLQSASKRQMFGILGEKREWDYKPRNEYDYGLEDEHSEIDSDDEKKNSKSRPVMPWAKKILEGRTAAIKVINLEMLCEFLPCYQKTPDIHRMFKMTPKRIKRSSSAIWNTPSS